MAKIVEEQEVAVADSVLREISSKDNEKVVENTEVQEPLAVDEHKEEIGETEQSAQTDYEQVEPAQTEDNIEEQHLAAEQSEAPVQRPKRTYKKKTTTQDTNSLPSTRLSYFTRYPDGSFCFISLPQTINVNVNIYHHYNCKNN